ncbi:MAG: hypothetical protein ABH914_02170 [Candidatus Omnitrophota bacterium]
MNTISNGHPGAVVLGLNLTGLGLVRSLGRRNIEVKGIDSDGFEIASFSRYCKKTICPPDALLNFLIERAKNSVDKEVLFPTADEYVLFVSRNREVLSRYYRFLLPDQEVLEAVLNKHKFYELAMRHGVSVPMTIYCPDEQALIKQTGGFSYPCILKPIYIHEFRKIYPNLKAVSVHNRDELIEKFREISGNGIKVCIQEIIPGADDQQYSACFYLNRNSHPLAVFTQRKLRQHPVGFGVGTYVDNTWCSEIVDLAGEFLKKIGYAGICEVEFRRDPRDNQYKMIEINPRLWTQHALAAKSNIDIAYTAYADLSDIKEFPDSRRQTQKRINWIFPPRDIRASLVYLFRGELRFKDWMRSFNGRKEWAIFAWDDLMPLLFSPVYFFKKLFYRGTGVNSIKARV